MSNKERIVKRAVFRLEVSQWLPGFRFDHDKETPGQVFRSLSFPSSRDIGFFARCEPKKLCVVHFGATYLKSDRGFKSHSGQLTVSTLKAPTQLNISLYSSTRI